ncbi:MAG: glycoside hydrolase family 31 protein [Clostridia bacterium]|nr:glycoside hydrolase family 31 protein [Clostridia bacterium]
MKPAGYLKHTDTEVYFYNGEGILFRLSNEGACGWRLRGGEGRDVGASQSLSLYMGEAVPDRTERLTVQVCDGEIRVHAKDGTCAVLPRGGAFRLAFLDASGREVTALTELSLSDVRVGLCATLEEREGMFGGGERFDAINRRGARIDLYTSDGWNCSDTTYLAIPLFLTTRGAGIFFNHFEPGTLDCGVARADAWRYSMDCAYLDCYIYATGRAEDVYRGYTALSGHALMPAPWMHGVQICRSGCDMSTFDVDFSYDTLEEIPDYDTRYLRRGEEYVLLTDATPEERAACQYIYAPKDGALAVSHLKNDAGRYYRCGYQSNPIGDSVKTIMERFMGEGMKPDAAIMEGFGWSACYSDSDAGRAKYDDLKRAVDWLHANGIKAMVYIRAGGVRSDAVGFKEEYKVHADVEVRHPDGTVEVRENTTLIPWMMGKADNPDGSKRGDDYLDITNDEALEWYFDRIWGDSIALGLDGVKIDFCECMPDGDRQYSTTYTRYKWKHPEKLLGGTEHHAYATYFISRFCKRMQELQAEKKIGEGFMVLSRGGGIGSQRSPYMWAGDQVRTFEKLDDMLFSVITSGLSGVPFMTYDMGGYHYVGKFGYYREGQKAYETEVFNRAVEFTAFTSNIQTHGDVRHVYEMDEDAKEIYRLYTRLHARLIPYVSRYARISCECGMPVVRHPVLFDLQDENLYGLTDEFMLGEGLLIAPIMTEQTFSRDVYLPRGNWVNLLTGERLAGAQTVRVSASMAQIPVFLNASSPDAASLAPIFEGAEWRKIAAWG